MVGPLCWWLDIKDLKNSLQEYQWSEVKVRIIFMEGSIIKFSLFLLYPLESPSSVHFTVYVLGSHSEALSKLHIRTTASSGVSFDSYQRCPAYESPTRSLRQRWTKLCRFNSPIVGTGGHFQSCPEQPSLTTSSHSTPSLGPARKWGLCSPCEFTAPTHAEGQNLRGFQPSHFGVKLSSVFPFHSQ